MNSNNKIVNQLFICYAFSLSICAVTSKYVDSLTEFHIGQWDICFSDHRNERNHPIARHFFLMKTTHFVVVAFLVVVVLRMSAQTYRKPRICLYKFVVNWLLAFIVA